MKKVTFESIVYLSILGSQLKIIHPDLLTVSRIETFAVRAMLRLGDVGKGVNAIAVDAQGLPVRRGWLLRVAHSYTPGINTERSKKKSHQQRSSYHL